MADSYRAKRMLSSMTPTVVTHSDSVQMVLGAAGGPRIISAVLQIFLNMALHRMDAQQATAMPRIHHQYLPDFIYFESFSLSNEVLDNLRKKGHSLKALRDLARAHTLRYNANGRIETGIDPRGNGASKGY